MVNATFSYKGYQFAFDFTEKDVVIRLLDENEQVCSVYLVNAQVYDQVDLYELFEELIRSITYEGIENATYKLIE